MNERIKELIKQADIEFDVSSDHYGVDTAVVIPYDLEKFAELIIQKCISKIALVGISGFDNEDISWAVQTAITSIKGHFGVEEQTIEQDQVPLPTNREQAMAMLRVATFYLDTQK